MLIDQLKIFREKLDQIDLHIANLLDERMNIVDQIGQIKHEHDLKVMDQAREAAIFQHVQEVVKHPVLKEGIVKIYQTILQESRAAQQFLQHKDFPFRRVGIVGLGLMGGSICKALKTKDSSIEIVALAFKEDPTQLALEEKWIDRVHLTLNELVAECEILVLASPISTIFILADEIAACSLEPGKKLIIVDIASVKSHTLAQFESLTNSQIEFLSTHPMAGKEKAGFEHSQASLFIGAKWLIVPHNKNAPATLTQMNQFVYYIGATPQYHTEAEHDRQAALISHLPGLISKAFFHFVKEEDSKSLDMAGPGFHSFTRLANSNPQMRAEIEKYNKKNIQHYSNRWLNYLNEQIAKL